MHDSPSHPASAPARRNPVTRATLFWTLPAWGRYGLYALYAFAAYAVVRTYSLNSSHYLVLDDYMAGRERLPFQKRLLPVLLLEQLQRIPLPDSLLRGRKGIFAHPDLIFMFAIDVGAFLVAGAAAVWLYRRIAPHGRYALLVFPIYLYAAVWTYVMHTEHNFYYQYDMMSLAFFTLGLCCIQARRFWPLLAVVAIGSVNRETTLFLIVIFVIDAFAPGLQHDRRGVRAVQAAVLFVAWFAIKLWLEHRYALNDRSEEFLRVRENIGRLTPQHWPEVIGGCGFLLPVVLLLRRRVPDRRVAAWLLLIPFWFVVMLFYGVLTETRIYGELCGLVAVAAALLLDSHAAATRPAAG